MTPPPDVVAITTGMPEQRLAPGEPLFDRGDDAGRVVGVLVDGSLHVELDGVVIDRLTTSGAFVGEIGALLGTARTASVVAASPSTVRLIGDPESFFDTHPQLALELARQLAGRLQRILAYLADVRQQYADAEGHLGMVDAVLGRLSARAPIEIEPGSDRSPDY
jgi:CRP-like cAMP-binding protein